MNICCQNSAYVGRTNLSQDDTIHKQLQEKIDTLTLNLDSTNSNLDTTNSNLNILQTNYNITSNYIVSNDKINLQTIPSNYIYNPNLNNND